MIAYQKPNHPTNPLADMLPSLAFRRLPLYIFLMYSLIFWYIRHILNHPRPSHLIHPFELHTGYLWHWLISNDRPVLVQFYGLQGHPSLNYCCNR